MGNRYIFDYPDAFKTLPDYTAHAGQEVTVLRPAKAEGRRGVTRDEADYVFEGEAMFIIRADDGWEGIAWRSELRRIVSATPN